MITATARIEDAEHPGGGVARIRVFGRDRLLERGIVRIQSISNRKWLGPSGWVQNPVDLQVSEQKLEGDDLVVFLFGSVVDEIKPTTAVRIEIREIGLVHDQHWPAIRPSLSSVTVFPISDPRHRLDPSRIEKPERQQPPDPEDLQTQEGASDETHAADEASVPAEETPVTAEEVEGTPPTEAQQPISEPTLPERQETREPRSGGWLLAVIALASGVIAGAGVLFFLMQYWYLGYVQDPTAAALAQTAPVAAQPENRAGDDSDRTISNFRQELDTLRSENSELIRRAQTSETVANEAIAESERLRQELVALGAERDRADAQNERLTQMLEAERDRFRRRVAELQAQLDGQGGAESTQDKMALAVAAYGALPSDVFQPGEPPTDAAETERKAQGNPAQAVEIYLLAGDKAATVESRLHWYRRSAALGHPLAMFRLGASYLVGNGVAKDEDTGFQLMRIAMALSGGNPGIGERIAQLIATGYFSSVPPELADGYR